MTELRIETIPAIFNFPSRPYFFLPNRKRFALHRRVLKQRLLSEDGIRRKEKSVSCSISCPSLRSSLALFPSLHGLWRDYCARFLNFTKPIIHLFNQKCCRKWRIASICWWFSCFGFLGCKAARRMGASQNIWISLHGHRRSKKSLATSVLNA